MPDSSVAPTTLSTDQLLKIAVAALEDIKGKEITVLDVGHLTSMFDKMIVASGDSTRQVKSLAANVQKKLKEAGAEIVGIEGEQVGEWVLVDAGGLIIHVMHPTVRLHYNLEELWGAARKSRASH